jgi:ribosome-associated protein
MLSEDGENPVRNVSVDTKMDIMEICKDVMSSDHRRFRAECIRAQLMGIQLIVLIEEEPPYGKIDLWEVPRWKSSNQFHRYGDPMTLVDPKTLRKALITMTKKYGVKFRFCTRRQSPSRVIKYLTGEFE